MLFSFGFIFICLIPVMYFYLIEVDFALIDLRWWRWRRVVDGLIIFIGLRGARDCTSLAGARCRGRHVEASVMVGRVCVVGWGCLRLGVDVGSSSLVACLGLFLGLEHGGRQMLGSISRGLLDPKHEKDTKLDYQEMVDPKVTRTR
jgi:hypothetical protein